MNRVEYMRRLEELLSDISTEEREDAIAYYNDYFDAGGEENEQANIEALGSPENLARTIRLASNEAEAIDGEFTETGYHDDISESSELVENTAIIKRGIRGWNTSTIIIVIVLGILLLPIVGPILLGAVGTVLGIIAGIIGIVIGIICAVYGIGIGAFAAGAGGIIYGVISLIIAGKPLGSMLIIGVSLMALSLGVAIIMAATYGLVKSFPPLLRAVVDIAVSFYEWIKQLIFGRRDNNDANM